MKRIEQIEIQGIHFNLEEGAYKKLVRFTDMAKNYFETHENGTGNWSDFEKQLANLLQKFQHNKDQVIEIESVTQIIEQIEATGTFAKDTTSTGMSFQKRLFRDLDNHKIGGVCSGLGAYFRIDPVFIRVAFILLIIPFAGIPFLVYFIFWALVPAAISPAEKSELHGHFRDTRENQEFGQQSQDVHHKKQSNESGSLAEIFYIAGRSIVILLGILVILIGTLLLIGFLGTLAFGNGFWNGFHFGFDDFFPFLKMEVFTPLLWISLLFTFLTPIVALVYLGIKLLIPYPVNDSKLWYTIAIIWILSLVSFIGLAMENTKKMPSNRDEDTAFYNQPIKLESIQMDVKFPFEFEAMCDGDV